MTSQESNRLRPFSRLAWQSRGVAKHLLLIKHKSHGPCLIRCYPDQMSLVVFQGPFLFLSRLRYIWPQSKAQGTCQHHIAQTLEGFNQISLRFNHKLVYQAGGFAIFRCYFHPSASRDGPLGAGGQALSLLESSTGGSSTAGLIAREQHLFGESFGGRIDYQTQLSFIEHGSHLMTLVRFEYIACL